MNHTQKKYAQDRVGQLTDAHRARIEEESKTKRRPEMTPDEKCRMIREGAAVLIPERVIPSGRYRDLPTVADVFDFPGEADIDAHNLRVEEETQKRLAVLRAEAGDLRDDLMLGDAAEALEKLKAFAEKGF